MTHALTRHPVYNLPAAPATKVHRCAVVGCRMMTLNGYVACRAHWLALPRPTRHILAEAFRQRTTRPELHDEAVAIACRLVNAAAQEQQAS